MYFSASSKASIVTFSSKRYSTLLVFAICSRRRCIRQDIHLALCTKLKSTALTSCREIMITASLLGLKSHASKRLHHTGWSHYMAEGLKRLPEARSTRCSCSILFTTTPKKERNPWYLQLSNLTLTWKCRKLHPKISVFAFSSEQQFEAYQPVFEFPNVFLLRKNCCINYSTLNTILVSNAINQKAIFYYATSLS